MTPAASHLTPETQLHLESHVMRLRLLEFWASFQLKIENIQKSAQCVCVCVIAVWKIKTQLIRKK